MKLHYNRNLKPLASNLRKTANLSEVLLWKQLKGDALGVRFLRQRPVANYIVDFYCQKLKLAIEIDGVSHDSKIEEDIRRQKMIEVEGIHFLRFLDRDIKENLESVMREIKTFIEKSSVAGSRKNNSLSSKGAIKIPPA